MRTGLAWVDFSEKEQDQMGQIIDLFNDKTTRDELGFGTVRDALADILFPGTSTLQTRARYILFVPWIILKAEAKAKSTSELDALINKYEIQLISALKAGGEGDNAGVVGISAGEDIDKLPSEIFWAGLREWNIYLKLGSRSSYPRLRFNDKSKDIKFSGEIDDDSNKSGDNFWHVTVKAPPKFLEKSTFQLETEEAKFLKEAIATSHPQSLLAWMLNSKIKTSGAFPWDCISRSEINPELARSLEYAELFSQLALGAVMLYQIHLARLINAGSDVKRLGELFKDWLVETRDMPEMKSWEMPKFWHHLREENSRLGKPTQDFVENWLAITRSNKTAKQIIEDMEIFDLLLSREVAMKSSKRARLATESARDNWDTSSTPSRINFRWHRVARIVNDITSKL